MLWSLNKPWHLLTHQNGKLKWARNMIEWCSRRYGKLYLRQVYYPRPRFWNLHGQWSKKLWYQAHTFDQKRLQPRYQDSIMMLTTSHHQWLTLSQFGLHSWLCCYAVLQGGELMSMVLFLSDSSRKEIQRFIWIFQMECKRGTQTTWSQW